MSEKPTFCPRCRKMHAGICTEGPAVLPMKTITAKEAVEMFPPKFDKRAYQRDYMRKRRAAKP